MVEIFSYIDWWIPTFIFDHQVAIEFLFNWFAGVQLNHSTGFDSWDPEIDYRTDQNTDHRSNRINGNIDFSLTLPSKFKSKQNDNWGFASLDRNGKLAGSNIHFLILFLFFFRISIDSQLFNITCINKKANHFNKENMWLACERELVGKESLEVKVE
jgi:hypothetical protein